MKHVKQLPQWLLIGTLVMVSGYCEVTLFVDFAEDTNTIDQIQLGALAGSLVLAQHTLAQKAGRLFAKGHSKAAALLGLLVFALLAISITASTVFYEARYQASRSADLQAGTGYQVRSQLIADKQASISSFQDLANKEEAKGNTWMAGQHRLKAQEIQQQLPALLADLEQLQTPQTSAAGIVADLLANYRWLAWVAFASIADFIPGLLIVLATIYPETTRQQRKPTEHAGSPELTSSTEATLQTPQDETPTDQQQTENQQPPTLFKLIEQLDRMPSWKECNTRGMSYRQYKKQRDELEKAGMVRNAGDGTGFELAAGGVA